MTSAPSSSAPSPAAPQGNASGASLVARLRKGLSGHAYVWVALAAAGAGVLAWAIHSGRLTDLAGFDRTAAQEAITRSREQLNTMHAARDGRRKLNARLASVVNASLGDRVDVVDSALRARLNRIAEETGLRDLIVATGQPTERRNPARQELQRLPRHLREEPDFVEVRATISGEGAADQVLRLVHRISVDPMVKRVESVKFDPVRDGSRVRVTLRLATIFLPGQAPTALPEGPSAEALAGFNRYAVLVQRNPFRLPDPPAAPAATPPAVVAAAAESSEAPAVVPSPEAILGFPYGQWMLTGVIDGPAGTEAWFRNTATGESRVLRVRDSIAEFVLVGLAPQGARIAAGGATYLLRVGDSLDARAVETASK